MCQLTNGGWSNECTFCEKERGEKQKRPLSLFPGVPCSSKCVSGGAGGVASAGCGGAIKPPKPIVLKCGNRAQTADRSRSPEDWRYDAQFAQHALTARPVLNAAQKKNEEDISVPVVLECLVAGEAFKWAENQAVCLRANGGQNVTRPAWFERLLENTPMKRPG